MKKLLILAGFIFLTSLHAQTGNTGINTTAPKATLDVSLPSNYANGQLAGVAIPQLTGDQIEAMSASTPKVGTIVYATAVSTATTKDVTAVGYWYWKDATDKWEPFTLGTSASGNTVDWSVNGNSGTAAANYLGTKDNQPLNFKTNATTDTNPKMTILSNGNVGIGTSNPQYPLHVFNNMPIIPHPRGGLIVEGADNNIFGSRIGMIYRGTDGAGAGNNVVQGYRYRGTKANPLSLLKGDELVGIAGFGFNGVEVLAGGSGIISIVAEEDFTTTAIGAKISFHTATNGTINALERMVIKHNGNIGISTPNPLAKLHIDGAADNPATETPIATQQANDVVVTSAGAIGIGRTSADARVHIHNTNPNLSAFHSVTDSSDGMTMDDINIESYGTRPMITLTTVSSGGTLANPIALSTDNPLFNIRTVAKTTTGYVGCTDYRTTYKGDGTNALSQTEFYNSNALAMTIDKNNNLGIGTLSPVQKLDVIGNVKSSGSFISGTTTYPDYVFQNYYSQKPSSLNESYKFLSLNETEDFIKKNGHLPGFKPASEIVKEGSFDVSDTSLKTLEKVEELYLHTIEQDKKLKEQHKQIATQQQTINELMKRLEALEKK